MLHTSVNVKIEYHILQPAPSTSCLYSILSKQMLGWYRSTKQLLPFCSFRFNIRDCPQFAITQLWRWENIASYEDAQFCVYFTIGCLSSTRILKWRWENIASYEDAEFCVHFTIGCLSSTRMLRWWWENIASYEDAEFCVYFTIGCLSSTRMLRWRWENIASYEDA
jgi:hypothetical protein